jgi:hypothetical protein
VNTAATKPNAGLRPTDYWWLWVLDTVLVSGAILFFLATFYGTFEFFGRACVRALLPLVPVLVLVGGGGSTVFALTKVLIDKRGLNRSLAVALLVGQALVVVAPLVALGIWKSPMHRLSYICAGHTPSSVSDVQLTGYSTFLREEWLAMFRTDERAFQSMVAQAQLAPADGSEFQKLFDASSLKTTRSGKNLSLPADARCFKRVFKIEEHQRGEIYAFFDPTMSTAVVWRGYHD